jgi:hypothetical protein
MGKNSKNNYNFIIYIQNYLQNGQWTCLEKKWGYDNICVDSQHFYLAKSTLLFGHTA